MGLLRSRKRFQEGWRERGCSCIKSAGAKERRLSTAASSEGIKEERDL